MQNNNTFKNGFKDLILWQKSKILTIKIYKYFSHIRDYGFRDQIQRASISIMNNVAEGFERNNKKEFKHFLLIAKGSCGEVASMVEVAYELKYITHVEFIDISQTLIEVQKLSSSLIYSIKNKLETQQKIKNFKLLSL